MARKIINSSQDKPKENKIGFKLLPRKIQMDSNKVYAIFKNPIGDNEKIKVFLDNGDLKEVPIKRMNPYVCRFLVPVECIKFMNILKIHIYCEERLFGTAEIKCETKMGQLCGLLRNINSPCELMCSALNMGTLHDVDEFMAATFKKNMPGPEFKLLESKEKLWAKKSKEECPTLLHFAAQYGLNLLMKEILQCPNAIAACSIKNAMGLVPSQLANYSGHAEITRVLLDFQKHGDATFKKSLSLSSIAPPPVYQNSASNPLNNYDIPPAPVLVPEVQPKSEFITNSGDIYSVVNNSNKNLNSQQSFDASTFKKIDIEKDFLVRFDDSPKELNLNLGQDQNNFCEDNSKPLAVKNVKKTDKLCSSWNDESQEAQKSLEQLKDLYAKSNKSKLNKKNSSSLLELRQFFDSIGCKLKRKNSVGSKSAIWSFKKGSNTQPKAASTNSDSNSRPVSAFSVTSNTSSSNGSSVDGISTISIGSDSGILSDCYEDGSHYKNIPRRDAWIRNANLHHSCNSLIAEKPPAPPPRPPRTFIRSMSVRENIYQNSPIRLPFNTKDITFSKSCTCRKDTDSMKNQSCCISENSNGMENYDVPPMAKFHNQAVPTVFNVKTTFDQFKAKLNLLNSDDMAYDIVPAPVPLLQNVSITHRADELLNTNACPDYDIPKTQEQLSEVCQKPKVVGASQNLRKLRNLKPDYYNISFNDSRQIIIDDDDSIPDEIAPPPPDDEHYKVVGLPIHITEK